MHFLRPFIPKSSLPEIAKVGLQLSINGQVKQKGEASDMVFSVPQLIQHVSSILTLNVSVLLKRG